MVRLLAAPGSWPGTSVPNKRQNQIFGCNRRKIDVGQLRPTGKLKAKAGFSFFHCDLITGATTEWAFLFFVVRLTDNVEGGGTGFVFNCEIYEVICSL